MGDRRGPLLKIILRKKGWKWEGGVASYQGDIRTVQIQTSGSTNGYYVVDGRPYFMADNAVKAAEKIGDRG